MKHMAKFPEHNVGRNRGWPFAITFAFLKSGTEVYKGSWNNIKKAITDRKELCHALTISYFNGGFRRKSYNIIGYCPEDLWISLTRMSNHETRDTKHNHWQKMFLPALDKRTKYCLIVQEDMAAKGLKRKDSPDRYTDTLLNKWRTLPNCYLKELDLALSKSIYKREVSHESETSGKAQA